MGGAIKNEYPITTFLNALIAGQSRDEFVRSLGYWKRIDRGRHRLDLWMDHGNGHDKILSQIAGRYPNASEALQSAVQATRKAKAAEHEAARREATRDIEERERKRFRPFIWVVTEHGATSGFNAMVERRLKVLQFGEDFEGLSESERLAVVQKRVQEHYAETGGRLYQFGAILRYRYANTFDTTIVLTPQGDVIDYAGNQILLPEVWWALHPQEFLA